MIWFYLLFFVMEFILGYVMYSAISYRVVPGDIIYKDYVLSHYGICSCSKQDAEKHGRYYYLPETDEYYVCNEEIFLQKYTFKLNKFYQILMVASFCLSGLPCGIALIAREESLFDISFFIALGAFFFTLLSCSVVSNVDKRCKEQHEVFRKIKNSQLPNVPLHILRQESIDEIKKIIYRDCYDHAEGCFTDEEKMILKSGNPSQKLYLKNVIENGFCEDRLSLDFLFSNSSSKK